MTILLNACETLYLPLAQPNRMFPWEVFHGKNRMGAFATQEECFRHALRLANSLGSRGGSAVRLKIEDEQGGWTTVDGYVPEPAVREVAPVRRALQRE